MSETESNARPPALPAHPSVTERLFSRVAVFRVGVALLVLGSLAAAWWSVTRVLLPVQAQYKELSVKVSWLATDVDDLQRSCSREIVQQTSARLEKAHAQLFSDEHALAAWVDDLHTQAGPLALEAKASFGKTVALIGNEKGLLLIPAIIEVGLSGDRERVASQSASQRLSKLMLRLSSSGKRVDLEELTVHGNGLTVENSVLVLNLWARQEAAK